MSSGKEDFKSLWLKSEVDVRNPSSVAEFYRDQFVEAYELGYWHAGLLNGEPPLNYAYAAWIAREHQLMRVLDFGSGIGSGSICLAKVGCEVYSADIANKLLDFVGLRMRQHGYLSHTVDLADRNRLPKNYFDLITCFDVLEHIPDQLGKVRELESYLRPGGYLIVNFMNDSTHVDRPMHVSSAHNWLALVRQTGLWPKWSQSRQGAQVLIKRSGAHLLNWMASWKDWIDAYYQRKTSEPTSSNRGV
jgi:2-polyprenyl-3-methyl-5-hydroxy-6-metoxy-1,4-benzoquinol methylase